MIYLVFTIFSIFVHYSTQNSSYASSVSLTSHQQVLNKQDLWLHGKQVYEQNCMGCHGKDGDGKGPAAIMLDPKPRNFKSGIFKFKSTSWEALPTDMDLLKTITQGLYGTSMPAFNLLPEVSRMGVIEYIKSFAPEVWNKSENIQAPLAMNYINNKDFETHTAFIEKAKRGRKIYVENCHICHGSKGKGDGEGSVGLEDEWGFPIKPADLTRLRIKTGASVNDILKVVLVGIPGTPMPSFKETFSSQDASDVAAFVLYLRGLNANMYEKNPIEPITDNAN